MAIFSIVYCGEEGCDYVCAYGAGRIVADAVTHRTSEGGVHKGSTVVVVDNFDLNLLDAKTRKISTDYLKNTYPKKQK